MQETSNGGSENVLSLTSISKSFGTVKALNGVSFDLRKGEIHALMGENGAGKSTLIKVLAGVHQPDGGEIRINGAVIHFKSVTDSLNSGISVVYQELALVDDMTVAENLFLGKEPVRRTGLVDAEQMVREATDFLAQFDVRIDPRTKVHNLSVGEQQLVEIAKALLNRSRVIVMDEPTAALSLHEAERLYEIVRALKVSGCSIVYVSHRMEEIFRLSDRVTVLRDGRYVATRPTAETDIDELVRLMVGRDVGELNHVRSSGGGAAVLEVRNVNRGSVVRDVSFSLHKGEILGIYGLMGAGRTELARAIFGVDRIDSGSVLVDGTPVTIRSPADAIRAGLAMVPESRKEQGLFLDNTVGFNLSINVVRDLSRFGFVQRGKEADLARRAVQDRSIKTTSLATLAGRLSGGNQQKIVLSKWLSINPKVLILDEPTRGIDVAAKMEIYSSIYALADEGLAIMVISSDLPEIMQISDRIGIICAGRLVTRVERPDFSEEHLLKAASGL